MVCHQLGYGGAESYSVNHRYGIQEQIFSLKNVYCRGDEASLTDCSFEEHKGGVSVLADGRVAGVSCMMDEPTTWAPETTWPSMNTTTSVPSTCPHGWLDAGHLGCFLLQQNMTVNSW